MPSLWLICAVLLWEGEKLRPLRYIYLLILGTVVPSAWLWVDVLGLDTRLFDITTAFIFEIALEILNFLMAEPVEKLKIIFVRLLDKTNVALDQCIILFHHRAT